MSTKLVCYKDYVAGWLDSSVHEFLAGFPPGGASTKYALISCLDSHSHPASLLDKSPELASIADQLHVVGSGLLLPTDALIEADSRRQVFFGFDEVWFFPKKCIQPKPTSASLVGPARVSQAQFDKLGRWMLENGSSLGLGGGEGLNFVVRAHGLVRFLLGYSIEQPQPALASA